MTDHSPAGLRRPDAGATIGSTAATLRQHANSIQQGTFTLTVTTTAADMEVTFPTPFTSAPMVHCSIIDTAVPSSGHRSDRWGDAAGGNGGLGTPTKFYFRSQRNSGTATIRVMWTAIGQGTEVGG